MVAVVVISGRYTRPMAAPGAPGPRAGRWTRGCPRTLMAPGRVCERVRPLPVVQWVILALFLRPSRSSPRGGSLPGDHSLAGALVRTAAPVA